MFKRIPERLDRPTFWMWAVPLVLGHLLLAAILMSGATSLGAADTIVIIWLAMVVAARFHDIGWPRWIPLVFILGTMLVLPLVAVVLAIATKATAAGLPNLMNNIGLIAGPLNLLLLIVAGAVPGDHEADRLAATVQVFDDGPPPVPQSDPVLAPPVALHQFQARDAWVVAGGVLLIVLAVAAFFGGGITHRQQASAPAPIPAVSAPAYPPVHVQVPLPAYTPPPAHEPVPLPSAAVHLNPQQIPEGNGLTKSTNDFLRQLLQSPTSRR